MSAITITAANVGIGALTVGLETVTYGETVTQGQPVYLKASDQRYWKADANASSATADARGIALTPGGAGDAGVIHKGGKIKIGGTVVIGQSYCVGATAGEIVPYSDLTTGDYVTYLGTASTSSVIDVFIKATGIAKP